jgi:hypothetical protein
MKKCFANGNKLSDEGGRREGDLVEVQKRAGVE